MTDPAPQWACMPQITCLRASAIGTGPFWVWSGLTQTDKADTAPPDATAPPCPTLATVKPPATLSKADT
ncbi:MAG: hypothetical protein WCC57_12425 [Paracoccaceae bacterium]